MGGSRCPARRPELFAVESSQSLKVVASNFRADDDVQLVVGRPEPEVERPVVRLAERERVPGVVRAPHAPRFDVRQEWAPESWKADPDEIACIGSALLSSSAGAEEGLRALERYLESAITLWKSYLGDDPCRIHR